MTVRRKRGRASGAELSVANVTVLPSRPRPPVSLSVSEAELFAQIVGSLPIDWFTAGNLPLLVSYVRTCSLVEVATQECSRRIAEGSLVVKSNSGTESIPACFRLRLESVKQMADLSTKLRLTNQSRYDKRVAANVARKGNPSRLWDPASRDTLPRDREDS